MSTTMFETVPPTIVPTTAPLVAASLAPEAELQQMLAGMPPTWYLVLTSALCCVPIVLLVAYWLGKVKCEKLVTWAVVAWVLSRTVELVYAYNVGKSAAEAQMRQQQGMAGMPMVM